MKKSDHTGGCLFALQVLEPVMRIMVEGEKEEAYLRSLAGELADILAGELS